MHDFTSKELYMSNGGQKIYIYKDGFMDVYKATPEEEAEWDKEIVANALTAIETETDRTVLQAAIDNLTYHRYLSLEEILFKYIRDSNPVRQAVFAAALWTRIAYPGSFAILLKLLKDKGEEAVDDVFLSLNDFKNHQGARAFLVGCLRGSDDKLVQYAIRTIETWAWSGMPALREGQLLAELKVQNRHLLSFKAAIERLEKILDVV